MLAVSAADYEDEAAHQQDMHHQRTGAFLIMQAQSEWPHVPDRENLRAPGWPAACGLDAHP